MNDLEKFPFEFDDPKEKSSSAKDDSFFDFDEPLTSAVPPKSKEDSIFDFDAPLTFDPSQPRETSSFDFDDPLEAPLVDPVPSSVQETDFNFFLNDPSGEVATPLIDEVIEPKEPDRVMECVCPKCAQISEVDVAQIPENSFVVTCSGCSKQMYFIRETSACRARRKAFEINCANCGKQLDQQAHCHSCGKSFPDYFIAVNPDEIRSKSRKEFFRKIWAAISKLNVSYNPEFGHLSHDDAPHHSAPARHKHTKPAVSSRSYLAPGIALLVVTILLVGGIFAYKSYKADQLYAENYIKALYCIKTGVDSNLKKCTTYKTEWESTAGRGFTPVVNAAEDAKAAKLRGEVDKYMQKMNEPPQKFSQAMSNLKNMQKIYLDSETLVQTKPSSLQEFSISVTALDKKMIQTSQELKSNLPGTLKNELEKAKLKYRGLKEF